MNLINVTGSTTLTGKAMSETESNASKTDLLLTAPSAQGQVILPRPNFDAVSLFTGIGGMDLGAHQAFNEAGAKLTVLLANDVWDASELNYPLNHEGPFLRKDILNVSAEEILERIGKRPGELGGVHGGSPCPGWSQLNRLRNKGNASLIDTNILTYKFISLVSQLSPNFFCLENVNGMGDIAVINGFNEIKLRFKEELKDYVIQARAIRTLYLGVPQDRVRYLFVGWHRRTGIEPQFPRPIKGSLQHLTIAAVAPEIDYIEIRGTRILRKENTEFFPTVPASEHVILKLKDGTTQKLSERPDILFKVFGYPEDFKIHKDLSFAKIHRLIGNSVPPPMAKAVFAEIVKSLLTLS